MVAVPETTFHETIPDHEKVFPQTETDPINELLLFFDPTKPEEAGKIRRIIKEQIDLPARKIMIEAMVLEISSQALEELGVQWNYSGSASDNNFVDKHLDGPGGSLVLGSIAYPATELNLMQRSRMFFRNLMSDSKHWYRMVLLRFFPARVS